MRKLYVREGGDWSTFRICHSFTQGVSCKRNVLQAPRANLWASTRTRVSVCACVYEWVSECVGGWVRAWKSLCYLDVDNCVSTCLHSRHVHIYRRDLSNLSFGTKVLLLSFPFDWMSPPGYVVGDNGSRWPANRHPCQKTKTCGVCTFPWAEESSRCPEDTRLLRGMMRLASDRFLFFAILRTYIWGFIHFLHRGYTGDHHLLIYWRASIMDLTFTSFRVMIWFAISNIFLLRSYVMDLSFVFEYIQTFSGQLFRG